MCDTPTAPSWAEQSSALSTAWLTRFGEAVTTLNRKALATLFHPQAILFGAGAYGPCDRFAAIHFGLLADTAKIAPLDRAYSLVTVHWQAPSPIVNGTPHTGRATFVLYATEPTATAKGSIQCVHAHFSEAQ